jgi:hypothetical protein
LILEILAVRKLKSIKFCFKFGSKQENCNNCRNNTNKFIKNIKKIKSNNKNKYINKKKFFLLSKNKKLFIKLNTSIKQEPLIQKI